LLIVMWWICCPFQVKRSPADRPTTQRHLHINAY